jgi:hypothetical protein
MRQLLLILGLVTVCAVPASVYYFTGNYQHYSQQQERLEALQKYRQRQLRNQRQIRQYSAFVQQADALVDEAKISGALPENWDRYEINMQRAVQFDELENLLIQANHGLAYYFKPSALEIRLPTASDDSAYAGAPPPAVETPTSETGDEAQPEQEPLSLVEGEDAALTLRGTFLVRRQ